MTQNEKLRVSGRIHILVEEDGKEPCEWEQDNLIVNNGTVLILNTIANTTPKLPLTNFAIGTSSTAVNKTQNALGTKVLTDAIGSATVNTVNTVQIKYYLTSASANGNTLREIGLFCGVDMFARSVLASPIVKTSAITATFTWTITVTQA
jgi:hypothetical protein